MMLRSDVGDAEAALHTILKTTAPGIEQFEKNQGRLFIQDAGHNCYLAQSLKGVS